MTDQHTPEADEDEIDLAVNVTLYPEGGETKVLRTIGLGLQTFVLLEMEEGDTEGELVLKFSGSLLNDFDELLEFMEGYTDALRDAIAKHKEAERG